MAQGIKTGGRQKGTPNRITRAFRDAVQVAYDAIGGDQAFAAWARENPTEFYRIAARLIPHQIAGPENDGLTIIVNRNVGLPDPREVSPKALTSALTHSVD